MAEIAANKTKAVLTGLTAGVAVAAAGTLYGAMAAGLGVRETLLPILLLPVLAPVLIGATRAFDDALGAAAVDGWAWLVLVDFCVLWWIWLSLSGSKMKSQQ